MLFRSVVGTYRMQSGATAAANLGYYSEQEFDFSPYQPMRNEILELGRASIDREHRTPEVLTLLWRGIAQYATDMQLRYLIGCSSLNSVDPREGWQMYAQLQNLAAHPFIRREIELLIGVVAEVLRRRRAGLHTVGADDALVCFVLYQQVLAEEIEVVGIEACFVGRLKAFAQFDIEDLEAQAASGVSILDRLRQAQPVAAYLGMNAMRSKRRRREKRNRKLGRGYCRGCNANSGDCAGD